MDVWSRPPLRLLAPIALTAFVLVLALIISTSGGSNPSTSASKAMLQKQHDLGTGRFAAPAQQRTSTAPAPGAGIYVVKVGDTLGSIAQKTGVAVAKLQQLNPTVDPQSLISGQKLRVR